MLGWLIAGVVAGATITSLGPDYKAERDCLDQTIRDHSQLLSDYDYINRTAKHYGFKGAVSFFYYLADYFDDSRINQLARFLNRMRELRNEVAHNGTVLYIKSSDLKCLAGCKDICQSYRRLC